MQTIRLIALATTLSFATTTTATSGEMMRQFSSSSETEQKSAMRTIIRSAQYPCQTVFIIFPMGEYRRVDFWSVRCDNNSDYLVSGSNIDGNTKVLSCETAVTIGAQCFSKFD